MRPVVALALAIVSEVAGTAALKASDGFTDPVAGAVVLVGYGGAFYLLSLALEDLAVGFVYATWSGVGICGAVLVGVVVFDEGVDLAALVGLALIVAGVAVLSGYSTAYSPAH
jgi:small multidrug resistance pump